MARRMPLHPTGAAQRLVRYLQTGRVLRRRMYATTPVPFLRRLHLIPDEAYFTGRLSDLPAWWASDPRFAPGFEFRAHVGTALDEWTDDSAPRGVDALPVDQAISQALDVATQPDPVAPLAAFLRRDEPWLPSPTVSVSDVRLPRRFVRPVPAQTTARPASTVRVKAALPVTRSERPHAAPSSEPPTHAPLSPPSVPPASRPIVSAPDNAQTLNDVIPPQPHVEHRATDGEPHTLFQSVAEQAGALHEPLSAMAGRETAIDPTVAPEIPQDAPPVIVRSESPSATGRTEAITSLSREAQETATSGEAASGLPTAAAHIDRARALAETVDAQIAMHDELSQPDRVKPAAQSRVAVPASSRRRARVEELPREQRTADAPDSRNSAPADGPNGRRAVPPSRSVPAPESPPEREGDRLFRPVEDGVDRSPAVWAARLARAMRSPAATPTSAASPARAADSGATAPRRPIRDRMSAPTRPPSMPTPSTSPTPPPTDMSEVNVSERARRFLKPIVGIDPATVTIVQGPAADDINAAHHTDALAVGSGTILVASAFTSELPRDLGLLAHELTHIARERRPRFIPPAARSRKGGTPPDQSEEAVARRVETRALALANDSAAQKAVVDRGSHDAAQSAQAEAIDVTPDVDAPIPLATPSTSDWGGLPAPWEPLPQWLTEPATGEASTQTQRSVDSRALPVASSSLIPMTVATSAPEMQPAVHAADAARVLDAGGAGPPAAGEGQPAAAPDIDHLARQVYAALKRRLEADARRERMFRG